MNKTAAAIIALNEETEEMRQTQKVPAQVRSAAAKTIGFHAAKTPRAVATLLPPLNLRKTGNAWPTAAAEPASAAASAPKYAPPTHAGRAPLAASANKVKMAALRLPLRATLVAPGLPEPYPRGSGKPIAREIKIANGAEPER